MKILCFAGSLRKGSYNKMLARSADNVLRGQEGIESTYLDLLDYPMPLYNQDVEQREFPQAARLLAEKVNSHQGLVIATPENNGSIAAVTKNTIDWLSRPPYNPWPGKWVLLLGASPGGLGAIRGLWHSRVPFEALGVFVFPEMLGLPRAHEAFDGEGRLKEKSDQERLHNILKKFIAAMD